MLDVYYLVQFLGRAVVRPLFEKSLETLTCLLPLSVQVLMVVVFEEVFKIRVVESPQLDELVVFVELAEGRGCARVETLEQLLPQLVSHYFAFTSGLVDVWVQGWHEAIDVHVHREQPHGLYAPLHRHRVDLPAQTLELCGKDVVHVA